MILNVNSDLRHVAWQVWGKKALQMRAQEIQIKEAAGPIIKTF